MNSSGMKRGLAATAISALAVTGLPFLATSAIAAPGDSMTVGSVGPTLNAGTIGGVVVLKTKSISEAEAEGDRAAAATPALKLANTALTGSPNSPSQTVSIVGTPVFVANGADGDSNKTDGFDEITMHVAVTTPAAGDTAEYAVFLDDDDDDAVDAAEARTQVEQTTSGPLSKIDVSPASQSAAQNVPSGAYTVTLQDAAGRTTQLNGGEQIDITSDVTVTPSEPVLSAVELELGTDTFTATGTTVGSYNIVLDATTTPDVKATATLNVTKAASLAAGEVDIVTGADDWNGFGDGNFGAPETNVRVDQSSIRIDIKGDPATDGNTTVTLNLAGTGITFGGKANSSVSTVLDSNGVGSLTITPDAGTVQVGDTIAITGSFAETLEFERAAVTDIVPTANPYFSKVGGTVDVTLKVVDQFGLPITEGFIEAQRDGVNSAADTPAQRKAVGSDGTVTYTFTDTKATAGQQENVDVKYFADQFSAVADFTELNATVIKYTTDGMGANYVASLDTKNTEAADYDASDVVVVPLSDAVANDDGGENESADLAITGGEGTSEMTVSVDNGALILAPTEDELSEGSESVTVALVGGALPAGYKVIGTKSGVVTVTMSSANRTETAQLTVATQDDTTQARNVAVSGPAEVEKGTTQIAYTAVITDAFGNPVVGFPVGQLNIQVTGPAQFQDSDAVSNAAGQLTLNVRVDDDAEGDVTIRVQGLGSQFGAAEDQVTSTSPANSGKGLPASSNVATATTAVVGGPVKPEVVLVGKNNGANPDRLKADAIDAAEGATARLFRKVRDGVWKKVGQKVLNSKGNARFKVADKNGKKLTTYRVKVSPTERTTKDRSTFEVR